MSELHQILSSFADKVNANDKVGRLISNWNPNIILSTTDSEAVFTIIVRNARISDITVGEEASGHEIRMEAASDILRSIFTGRTNPATAVLTGDLAVFGEAADHIRLDAVSMLIWGS